MSWFSEFSERAENILNVIDKNAALALNKQSISKQIKHMEVYSQPSDISSSNLENESPVFNSTSSDQLNRILYPSFTECPSSSDKNVNALDYQANVSTIIKDNNHEYLQNEMLQNEIHSLNNEISLLLNRVKIAEQKSVELIEKLNTVENKNSLLEEQISKLILEKHSIEDISAVYKNLSGSENILAKIANNNNNNKDSVNLHQHYDSQIQALLQEKIDLEDTLRRKQDEIILLKSRLSQKTYCFSADELQSRLRALTITLIQKQSSLDSLMTEKNALALKLSQLQKRYDEVLGILHQSRISMNDTDDVKAQIPVFKSGNRLLYHLKKICLPLNSLGINAEILFKKPSLTRLFLILYIVLMHVLIFSLIYLHMPASTEV